MSILHRLRSDLQRSVVEHQALLLAQVLRQRFTELTLGDLREILTSPLGRGLEKFKLVDLSRDEPIEDGGAVAVAPRRGPGRPRKVVPEAPELRRASVSPSATNSDYVASIGEILQFSGKAMTSGELRAKLGGSPSTMYRAVTELIKEGQVRSEGKPARYSWVGDEHEVDSEPEEASAPAPAKRGRPEGVSARTLEGRAQFDAAVMRVLEQADGWIGASQLRAQVGGSDNQVRIALHRLVGAGQVSRRGERNSTEYRAN